MSTTSLKTWGSSNWKREDLVADEVEHLAAGLEAPLRPAVALRLGGEERGAVEGDAEQLGLGALVLRLVEELQIEQVGELLDVGDGIGQAAGPHGVSDLVELLADVGGHGGRSAEWAVISDQ